MNAIIVDDDPADAEVLRLCLKAIPHVNVIEEVRTFAAAKRALARTDYELVFLDIRIGRESGLDLVPVVRPAAHIIFVTGRHDFAVRAFELNALDYILKPPTAPRLASAFRRIEARAAIDPEIQRSFNAADRIFLRGAAAGGRFALVNEIVAVLSAENYTQVFLVDGERWLIRRTMQAWQKLLPPETFVRVHRTALVNLATLLKSTGGRAKPRLCAFRDRDAVPVSRRLCRLCARIRG